MTFIISYEEMKAGYEKFKTRQPKSLFDRYAIELNYVRNLIRMAKEKGLEQDVFEYQKIEQENVKQLQALGYNVK